MINTEPAELLESVLELAKDAGARVMEVYEAAIEIEWKADRSPLTKADLCSHHTIVEGLRKLSPDIPILSEESSQEVSAEKRRRWSQFWLVDPLDGTKEFINRNGEFTVNIALIRSHRPVLGVVHVPAKDWSYFAERSRGAYKQTNAGSRRIKTARLGPGPVRVVGSRSHRGSSLDPFLARLGPHELLAMGSSLKFCLVAEGAADVYPRFGPTCEWDTAAAHAVLLCAGGQVVSLNGRSLRYNTGDDLLNPYFLAFGDASRDWTKYV